MFNGFTSTGSHVRYHSGIDRSCPEDSLQPQSFYLILQIFLAVSASIVVVMGFFRWANKRLELRIVKEIKDSTYQIQPKTNGGFSLTDLHIKMDGVVKDISVLKSAVLRLETDVALLEDDVEDLK